ncbi:MAG: hypothetical protein ACK4KV_15420 [Rhodocyclaceae bacterium]
MTRLFIFIAAPVSVATAFGFGVLPASYLAYAPDSGGMRVVGGFDAVRAAIDAGGWGRYLSALMMTAGIFYLNALAAYGGARWLARRRSRAED